MKIVINLNDPNSIDDAIQATLDFRAKLDVFRRQLTQELAQTGAEIAQVRFADAVYAGTNDAKTGFRITERGTKGVVYAEGNAVLFIEFGSGIYKADNPEERAEIVEGHVVQHGEYGRRQGANPHGWFYRGEKGKNVPDGTVDAYRKKKDGTKVMLPGIVRTYGNDANSSMWRSRQDLENKYSEIVREVWERVMK